MAETAIPAELRLTVQNFRGVRRASWAPEGVSALVGPNASGKSTLLEAFRFVHNAAKRTPKDAILVSGGMQAFLHHDPVPDHPGDDPALARVRFTVEVPEGTWTLAFSATNDNVGATYEEVLFLDGVTSDDESSPPREIGRPPLLAQTGWGRPGAMPPALAMNEAALRFNTRLGHIALYRPWEIQRLRGKPFSDPALDDTVLAPDGQNIFVVLQNWRDAREHAWRYEWVMDKMRSIHPRTVSELSLKKGMGVLSAELFAPGDETPLPIKAASDGILGTLLSLTAAAGGRDGGIVLVDEPENGLHPAAIRMLVDALRELHEKQNIHFVLATHSPILLNAFGEDPEDVWVTEQQPDATFPIRLTELRDPEWLANFRIGNIYGTGFGRQDPFSGSHE